MNPINENIIDFDNAILQYLRDENNQKVGMVMAAIDRETNTVKIGWSLTRSGSGDTFNKDRAYTIAAGRVELAHIHKVTIPFALVETQVLENFVHRCMKYFRSNNVQVFGRVRKDVDPVGQLRYEEYALM